MLFILIQISLLVVVCVSGCVYVCVWGWVEGGVYKSACMHLCTVWPLSVKVESSAEAYGKPQPSPRQLTIEAHSQEKPSETLDQNVSIQPSLLTSFFFIVLSP